VSLTERNAPIDGFMVASVQAVSECGEQFERPPTEAATRKAPLGRGAKWLGNEQNTWDPQIPHVLICIRACRNWDPEKKSPGR
jgi:hypothetical protein